MINRFYNRYLFLQVFDLSRLRNMNNYSVVTADVTTEHFGNARNVVGNEETDFIYVVGATNTTNYTCNGKHSFYCLQTKCKVMFLHCLSVHRVGSVFGGGLSRCGGVSRGVPA